MQRWLTSLGGGCAGLTWISLSFCRIITDAGLASLAGGCAGLTSVDLSYCENITDAGLASLAGRVPLLSIIL